MTGVDTNVLVRYLVEDDPEQARRVHKFLGTARAAGEQVWISSVVLCETLWILRSAFRRPRAEILNAVEQILDTDLFLVEEEDAVRRAVQISRRRPGDLADHLIGQLHLRKGCRFTLTFDRSLRGDTAFSVL